MDTPPGFAKLADPYNPVHSRDTAFWANKLDTSYYKGKFYLYFGVTPALVAYWPYAVLTGHYLSDRCVIAVFFAVAFLVLWEILTSVCRRYFPETNLAAFAPGIFIFGLALCLVQSGWVHEVARASGFLFVMLALGGIWLALHWTAWRNRCLLFASLCYGLAIGSRPSLLFGAIILLVPVLQTWSGASGTASHRKIAACFLSAIGPIMLIGLGLMTYNELRFGSPFEFGRRYQLTSDYESNTAQQMSVHYLWFNIRYYFLEPLTANAQFPFLRYDSLPHPPSGYADNPEFGSILFNYPFVILVFAVPLIWRNRPPKAIPGLTWFILALFLLFLTCALTDCFLLAAQVFYELDFVPPLVLLAFTCFLGLDRVYVHSPGRRRIARFGWYVLLGYSLVFNLLANINIRAYSCYCAGETLLERDRPDDALEQLQNAVLLDPRQMMYHNQLAIAYIKMGDTDNALAQEKKALAIDPNSTRALYNLASLLYQCGQSDEAFKYFEKALNGDPNHTNRLYASDNINNAWSLVSNPDTNERNGPLAMKLAVAACQETAYKDSQTLVISAAVFGETGRTNEAISLAQKAIRNARQNGESNLLETAKALLGRYQRNPSLVPLGQGTIRQK